MIDFLDYSDKEVILDNVVNERLKKNDTVYESIYNKRKPEHNEMDEFKVYYRRN